MIVLKVAILGVRFLLELCLLAALGYWGFRTGGNIFVLFAVAAIVSRALDSAWGREAITYNVQRSS